MKIYLLLLINGNNKIQIMRKKIRFLILCSLLLSIYSCNPWIRMSQSNWINIDLISSKSNDTLLIKYSFVKNLHLKRSVFFIIPEISDSFQPENRHRIALDTIRLRSEFMSGTDFKELHFNKDYYKKIAIDNNIEGETFLRFKYIMYIRGEYAIWYDHKHFEIRKIGNDMFVSKKTGNYDNRELQIRYWDNFFLDYNIKL